MAAEINNLKFDEASLSQIALQLLNLDNDCRIFLFDAPMGAGKTTLIKEMCKCLGSTGNFSSPTYSIVNEYSSQKGKIFHMDLYRLKSVEELLDIGIEAYLDSKNYCFIEWPALTKDMIESDFIQISISVESNNIHYISAAKIIPA